MTRFNDLRSESDELRATGWTPSPTSEAISVLLRRDSDSILVVAGRQIVTAERLEVLALGCDREIPDGQPIRRVLATLGDTTAATVIPWGFGKWWFERGSIVRALLDSNRPQRIFLGDNGGRPRLAGRPRMFAHARSRGIFVLNGSDPLALPEQGTRPGSYGFHLDETIPRTRPAERILELLRDLAVQPQPFGRLVSLQRFLSAQYRLRRSVAAVRRAREAPPL